MISLLGSALTCAIFGTCTTLQQAICVRLLQGIFAGAVGVARGSISFVTDASNEGRAYAILGCVFPRRRFTMKYNLNRYVDFAGVSVVWRGPSSEELVSVLQSADSHLTVLVSRKPSPEMARNV